MPIQRFVKYIFLIICISLLWITLVNVSKNENILLRILHRLEYFHGNKIPSYVHFVIGQSESNNSQRASGSSSPFSFTNYLTFLAACRHLRPEKFFVHYYNEPNTFWWNRTKHDPEINLILIKTRHIKSIFNKPVDHYAHRGDIVRLEALIQYGGIYLDTDVLTLRSFDPLLNINDVVMAHQDDNITTACNAVILAKKNATFLGRLYDAYRNFDQGCWDCLSVKHPGYLASIYPNEIKVLPTNAFFRPSWKESAALFESKNYNFTPNYACHLWNTVNSNRYLNKLTPDLALTLNNTFGRMVRHAIGIDTLIKLKKLGRS